MQQAGDHRPDGRKDCIQRRPQQEGGQVQMLRPPEHFENICAQMGGKEKARGKIQGFPAEQAVADGADHRHDKAVQKQPAAGGQAQPEEYPKHQHYPHKNTGPVPDLLQDPAAVRGVGDLPLPHRSALGAALDMLLHRGDAVPSGHAVLDQGDQIHTDLTGDLDHGEGPPFLNIA